MLPGITGRKVQQKSIRAGVAYSTRYVDAYVIYDMFVKEDARFIPAGKTVRYEKAAAKMLRHASTAP